MKCVLCEINNNQIDCFSIYKDTHCHAILDKFKLNCGHVLILSQSHKQSITELTNIERQHLMNMASNVSLAMKKANHKIKDIHFLINDGPGAYQHIPHVHLHLIPRYQFDTLYLLFNILTRFINPLNYLKNKKMQHSAEKISHYLTHR
ncbi:HIT family protein [Shewanella surugensis]|uniref:HIT family protein n=1 Tax=Shewanella surugensis TaxID=212020 RepID=A0ABT0LGP0_9GAMM|nr:HIT family protein [Shewanella surugensis]MCL1126871.1 HIT family protein [Shewanella surugensis]